MQQTIPQTVITLLNNYNSLLCASINQYGFCPEIINSQELQKIDTARLLCQTRGIIFLIEYAKIINDNKYVELAIQIYDTITKNYYNNITNEWLQYPNSTNTTDNATMLYEYSFLLTATAKLYTQTQDKKYITHMHTISENILTNYYQPQTKFKQLINNNNQVSQNALMHLFEAYLESFIALPEPYFQVKINELYLDFIPLFFNKHNSLMREYSNTEIYEPGHSFEWCSLLLEAHQNGIKHEINITDMVKSAEIFGTTSNQLVLPTIHDKNNKDIKIRIWPSLERLRYYAMAHKHNTVETSFDSLIQYFFSKDGLPFEYIDEQYRATQTNIKTTTGYHIINCFKYLISQKKE